MLGSLRFGLRQLRKSPGFAFTTLCTLALGIGATTAIFTLVYDVLLKPLPYAQPDRLIAVEEHIAEMEAQFPRLPVSANHFAFWQRNQHSFESMAAMKVEFIPLGSGNQPLQAQVLRSTVGLFSVLGAHPAQGRLLTASDDQPGHEHVIVLLDELWRRQFNADPQIVGKTVYLSGFPFTVVGVMPRDFHLPSLELMPGTEVTHSGLPQAIIPMAFNADQLAEQMGDYNYFCLGRLKPGVSQGQALAEIDSLEQRIVETIPGDLKVTLTADMTPLQMLLVGDNHKPMMILLAAVAGLLLVGCVNLANLFLARALGRRQELAIAAALGADARSLMAASLREIAPLSAAGCLMGLLLAEALLPVLQSHLPAALDFRGPLHVDWAGAACAIAAALVSMLLAGAVPAWMASRAAPQNALRADVRTSSESRSSKRLRSALVAGEVAASVALLLVAGLLTTSLLRLLHAERGFQSAQALTVKIHLPIHGYPYGNIRNGFYKRLVERVASLPGVQSAGLVSVLPLDGDFWVDSFVLPNQHLNFSQLPMQHIRWISPGYLESIRMPLIAGRTLSASDEGKNVAVITATMAHSTFGAQNPVGRQLIRAGSDEPFTVIGEVADAHTIALAKADPPMVYVPYWYRADPSAGMVVRTQLPAGSVADAIRAAVQQLDPGVVVSSIRTLDGVAGDAAGTARFAMQLVLLFAVAASLLAGLGVYGAVAYSVAQREREMALRRAVGAQTGDLYRLVLGQGLQPVILGLAAGLILAFACGHLIASQLYQTSPYNPLVAFTTVLLLLLLGALATLLPARRAARVEPMRALREQ
ncbi:ABC transporter permease [Telmatobacter bradus]|uniref:ABC transporter permease n=1 Tax=Telmatobacter bradus TaxID=474953 RepID=UPI003B42FCEE